MRVSDLLDTLHCDSGITHVYFVINDVASEVYDIMSVMLLPAFTEYRIRDVSYWSVDLTYSELMLCVYLE